MDHVTKFGDYVVAQKTGDRKKENEIIIGCIEELMKEMEAILKEEKGTYIPGSGTIIIKDHDDKLKGFFTVGAKFEMIEAEDKYKKNDNQNSDQNVRDGAEGKDPVRRENRNGPDPDDHRRYAPGLAPEGR